MTVETYPEMNAKIVDILRWDKNNALLLYAAQRIKDLVAEVERLQRELHDEQARRREWEKMYNQAVGTEEETGVIRKLCYRHHVEEFGTLPSGRRWEAASWITVNEDCCEECEALWLLAELEADTDVLPCGHPRSAATGDVTQWCAECEEEAR